MRARLAVLIALGFLGSAITAPAQVIGIYPDPGGERGCVDAEAGEFLDLYVVVKPLPGSGASSISSVRFQQPTLPCGVFPVYWIPVYPLTYIGTNITVDFQECVPLPAHVLTVQAIGMAHAECCRISVPPISATDCSGNAVPLIGGYSHWTLVDTLCGYIPPGNPYPPNGAASVPRDVTFSWSESPGPNYCANIDWYSIALGTAPNPQRVEYFSSDTFYDPPYLLKENTTYYWRVMVWGNGPTVSSPEWHFTTIGPVSVEQTTWGRIKALYRQ